MGSEEGDIYSNPVEQKIGKKATTLERKKKSSLTAVSPPFFSPSHVPGLVPVTTGPPPEGDYASAEDALKLSDIHAGMVDSLRRQPRRSPSMSPPPPPLSPPMHIPLAGVGEEQGVEPDTYDTVDKSQRTVQSPTGRGKGYDHLVVDDTAPTQGYDHLNPSPPSRPPRTDLAKTQGAPSSKYAPLSAVSGIGRDPAPPPPPLDVYDTLEGGEGPMYATIDVCKPKKKQLPPEPPISAVPHRSPSPSPVIQPRAKPHPPNSGKKPSSFGGRHQRIKSDDLSLRNNTSAPNVEQLYSVVQKKPHPKTKPRRAITPEEPMYSVPEKKKPPPIAPKPSSRSPTPNSERKRDEHMEATLLVPGTRTALGLTHIRSESFDTGLLPSAFPLRQGSLDAGPSPLRPDLMRTGRSHSLNQQHKIQRSPLTDQRSPSPEVRHS